MCVTAGAGESVDARVLAARQTKRVPLTHFSVCRSGRTSAVLRVKSTPGNATLWSPVSGSQSRARRILEGVAGATSVCTDLTVEHRRGSGYKTLGNWNVSDS